MKVEDTIYLDYQASTPVDDRVQQVMAAASVTHFANPHAADHALGWRAAAAIDTAAAQVGALFGLQGQDVVFTSGASEANAIAVRTAQAMPTHPQRTEILIGAGDHGSILNEVHYSCMDLKQIAIDNHGAPDAEHLRKLIGEHTALVSVIGVNNENGAITDIEAFSNICSRHGVPLHTDLAQAPLAIGLDLLALDIDMATVSAHKLYGPKGIGALLAGPGSIEFIKPVIVGAGQQDGRRGGTMPTELIMGFGEACRLVSEMGQKERSYVAGIRDRFVAILEEKQIAYLVGSPNNRHPGNALMRFPGQDAADLLARLQPRIAASTQSACSTGKIEPSHVVQAMGYDRQFASECIRFSFGRFSSDLQVDEAIATMCEELLLIQTPEYTY